MTLSEFKAWFEGYTESFDGPPTLAQFERIKAKLAETVAIITPKPSAAGLGQINGDINRLAQAGTLGRT